MNKEKNNYEYIICMFAYGKVHSVAFLLVYTISTGSYVGHYTLNNMQTIAHSRDKVLIVNMYARVLMFIRICMSNFEQSCNCGQLKDRMLCQLLRTYSSL